MQSIDDCEILSYFDRPINWKYDQRMFGVESQIMIGI